MANKYGCLMLMIPNPLREEIGTWLLENIPDYHLQGDGRVFDSHITLVFGFKDSSRRTLDKLGDLLRRHGPISVTLKGASLFTSGYGKWQSDDGDVLKIDVDSPQLHALNALITKHFETEDTHPEYKPHLTLAYLDPSISRLYEKKSVPFSNRALTLDTAIFSPPEGLPITIPLSLLRLPAAEKALSLFPTKEEAPPTFSPSTQLLGGRRLCLGKKRIRFPKVQKATLFSGKKMMEDAEPTGAGAEYTPVGPEDLGGEPVRREKRRKKRREKIPEPTDSPAPVAPAVTKRDFTEPEEVPEPETPTPEEMDTARRERRKKVRAGRPTHTPPIVESPLTRGGEPEQVEEPAEEGEQTGETPIETPPREEAAPPLEEVTEEAAEESTPPPEEKRSPWRKPSLRMVGRKPTPELREVLQTAKQYGIAENDAVHAAKEVEPAPLDKETWEKLREGLRAEAGERHANTFKEMARDLKEDENNRLLGEHGRELKDFLEIATREGLSEDARNLAEAAREKLTREVDRLQEMEKNAKQKLKDLSWEGIAHWKPPIDPNDPNEQPQETDEWKAQDQKERRLQESIEALNEHIDAFTGTRKKLVALLKEAQERQANPPDFDDPDALVSGLGIDPGRLKTIAGRITGETAQPVNTPIVLIDPEGNPHIVSGADALLAASQAGVDPEAVTLDFSGAETEEEKRQRLLEEAEANRQEFQERVPREEEEIPDITQEELGEQSAAEGADRLGMDLEEYTRARQNLVNKVQQNNGNHIANRLASFINAMPQVADWAMDQETRGVAPTQQEAEALDHYLQAAQDEPLLIEQLQGASYADIPKMLDRYEYEKDVPFIKTVPKEHLSTFLQRIEQRDRELGNQGLPSDTLTIRVRPNEIPKYGLKEGTPFILREEGEQGTTFLDGVVQDVVENEDGSLSVTIDKEKGTSKNWQALRTGVPEGLEEAAREAAAEDIETYGKFDEENNPNPIQPYDHTDRRQVWNRINGVDGDLDTAKSRLDDLGDYDHGEIGGMLEGIRESAYEEAYKQAQTEIEEEEEKQKEKLEEQIRDREEEIKNEVQEKLQDKVREELDEEEYKKLVEEVKQKMIDEDREYERREGRGKHIWADENAWLVEFGKRVRRKLNLYITSEEEENALEEAMREDQDLDNYRIELAEMNGEFDDKKTRQKKEEEREEEIRERSYELQEDIEQEMENNDEDLAKLYNEKDELEEKTIPHLEEVQESLSPLRQWAEYLDSRQREDDPRGWQKAYEIGYEAKDVEKPNPAYNKINDAYELESVLDSDELFNPDAIERRRKDFLPGGKDANAPNAFWFSNDLAEWKRKVEDYLDEKKKIDDATKTPDQERLYRLGKNDKDHLRPEGWSYRHTPSTDTPEEERNNWSSRYVSGSDLMRVLDKHDASNVLNDPKEYDRDRAPLDALYSTLYRAWKDHLKNGGLGGKDELDKVIDQTIGGFFAKNEWEGLEALARDNPLLAEDIRQHPIMDPKHPKRVARKEAQAITDFGAVPPGVEEIVDIFANNPVKGADLVNELQKGRAYITPRGELVQSRVLSGNTARKQNADKIARWLVSISPLAKKRWEDYIKDDPILNTPAGAAYDVFQEPYLFPEIIRALAKRRKEGTDKSFATKSHPRHRTKAMSSLNALSGGTLGPSSYPLPDRFSSLRRGKIKMKKVKSSPFFFGKKALEDHEEQEPEEAPVPLPEPALPKESNQPKSPKVGPSPLERGVQEEPPEVASGPEPRTRHRSEDYPNTGVAHERTDVRHPGFTRLPKKVRVPTRDPNMSEESGGDSEDSSESDEESRWRVESEEESQMDSDSGHEEDSEEEPELEEELESEEDKYTRPEPEWEEIDDVPEVVEEEPATIAPIAKTPDQEYREKTYKFLRTGRITAWRKLGTESNANQSMLVRFNEGQKAVFKPLEGEGSFLRTVIPEGEQTYREVAAASVADILGLYNLVPATTFRDVQGQKGSLQDFAHGCSPSWAALDPFGDYDEDLAIAAAFDFLIYNTDRHEGNWLVDAVGRLRLIDHGLTMPTDHRQFRSELFREARRCSLKIPEMFRNMDVETVNKIVEAVRKTLPEGKTTDKVVNLMLERLDALHDENTTFHSLLKQVGSTDIWEE